MAFVGFIGFMLCEWFIGSAGFAGFIIRSRIVSEAHEGCCSWVVVSSFASCLFRSSRLCARRWAPLAQKRLRVSDLC